MTGVTSVVGVPSTHLVIGENVKYNIIIMYIVQAFIIS